MDPERALAEIRAIMERIRQREQQYPDDDPRTTVELASEAAHKFNDLDAWLKGGGFLPKDWSRNVY